MINYFKKLIKRIKDKVANGRHTVHKGASMNWPGAGGSLPTMNWPGAGGSLPTEWIMPSTTSFLTEIELKPIIQCQCGNKIEIIVLSHGCGGKI